MLHEEEITLLSASFFFYLFPKFIYGRRQVCSEQITVAKKKKRASSNKQTFGAHRSQCKAKQQYLFPEIRSSQILPVISASSIWILIMKSD